jgi:hypothetical protein
VYPYPTLQLIKEKRKIITGLERSKNVEFCHELTQNFTQQNPDSLKARVCFTEIILP